MSSDDEKRLGRGIAGGLLHLDAPERLRFYAEALQRPGPPDPAGFDPLAERQWRMLLAQLWGSGVRHVPLGLHGRYSRAEVFAAFGQLNDARTFPGREGVFFCCAEAFGFDEATHCDVFFITLKKSERLFSPTTRYNDYAISPWEFHWESQSNTRQAHPRASATSTTPSVAAG